MEDGFVLSASSRTSIFPAYTCEQQLHMAQLSVAQRQISKALQKKGMLSRTRKRHILNPLRPISFAHRKYAKSSKSNPDTLLTVHLLYMDGP